MSELHELKKKLMDELRDQAREIVKKPRMNAGDLDTVNKLVKSIDRVCEIIEDEEEDGYSNAGSWNANIRGNYGDHVSYGGRRRDSRGRYSRDNGGYSRNGGYSMDSDLMDQLEDKMRNAKSDYEMDAIRRCMDVLRKG